MEKLSRETSCPKHPAGLYLAATPIGNAGDITLRVLQLLKEADAVYCEDTRRTSRLLALHQCPRTLEICHAHNERAITRQIINRIKKGQSCVFVSDAGMPLLSDPGGILTRCVLEESLPLFVLPGASAILTALLLSGLPPQPFAFQGFLPYKKGKRTKVLQTLSAFPGTLIFFESGRRLVRTLEDIIASLGEHRPCAIVREMTKIYEESHKGTLHACLEHYQQHSFPKGEITIVVAQAPKVPKAPVEPNHAQRL